MEPAGNLWGSERVLLDFLQVASKSGCEIGVCCPPNTPILPSLAKLPIKVFPTFVANLHRKSRFARIRAALHLLITTLRFRPHIIDVNQAGTTKIALFVARLLNIPITTHVRLAEDVDYLSTCWHNRPSSSRIICISQYIKDLFIDLPSLSIESKVMYDPYIPKFDVNSSILLSTNEVKFICVGRIVPVKGQDVLINSISLLNKIGINAGVEFIGSLETDPVFSMQLGELSRKLGLNNQITWAGYQKEIIPQISAKTALVCTSHTEPLGRVILEAWDAGTIPITWEGSGGAAEIIKASRGGLLYKEQTGESLAQVLKQSITLSLEERKELVQRGREWLRKNCDPELYVEKMLTIWHEAARNQ